MNKFFKIMILTLALAGLTNCSKGSVSQSSTAPSLNNGQGTGGDGTTNNPPPAPIDSVDLKGAVDSNDGNNKALTFDFDKTRGEFIIMVPMPAGVSFTPIGSFSKYPDITFSPIFDSATQKMKFGVRIPVKYILKGATFLPAASLPNGDALPAMPAGYGELPSLALNFPQNGNTQITLYIGVNAVGLYVSLPDNAALPFGFQVPIRNSDKTKTYGYLTYVPKKGTYAPGLFVSTLIPPAMARILEDYFHL